MDFMELMDDSNYNPEDSIREVVRMGYSREEAINLLNGRDKDGSISKEWPF